MALVNRTFMLDITPGAIPQVVKVSEYDVNRAYTVTLVDEGGVFEIPSGTTAKVEGSIGGNAFSETATVSGNTIVFELSESMTAYAGDAWVKIKLTQNSKSVSTCGFWLDCDRAGVEADTVIGADGFEQQIVNAVNDWLDEHPPASGGLTDDVKTALLDCFENVAWINSQGQTYYDALYAALYPPKTLVSISSFFAQGSAVIYDTDSLDALRQYLTVTATYDDTSTGIVTNYTLSGTLTVGTSTITVLYNGKTDTFNVEVNRIPPEYQEVEYIESTGTQRILLANVITNLKTDGWSADTVFQLTDSSATGSSGVLCQYQASCQWFGCWNTNVNYGNSTSALNKISVHTEWTETGIDNTINGTTTHGNYGTSGTNFTLPDFCIFAMPMSASTYDKYAKMKLYSMKLYKDGVLFADLVPCYRKADDVIGLYDAKRSVFLVNSGSGSFLKGGDV